MKATKIVKVKWIDSMSDNGRWTLAEDIDMKPTECTTLGFLVEGNEQFITVAQTLGMEPEQYCQMMCIPQKAITHLFVIEEHGVVQDGGAVDPNEPCRQESFETHYVKAENIT